jgi:hypothetical protein
MLLGFIVYQLLQQNILPVPLSEWQKTPRNPSLFQLKHAGYSG